MPKIKKIDTRDGFMKWLEKPDIDRNLAWVSRITGIPYNTLYSIFSKKERTLTSEIQETITTKTGYIF